MDIIARVDLGTDDIIEDDDLNVLGIVGVIMDGLPVGGIDWVIDGVFEEGLAVLEIGGVIE